MLAHLLPHSQDYISSELYVIVVKQGAVNSYLDHDLCGYWHITWLFHTLFTIVPVPAVLV